MKPRSYFEENNLPLKDYYAQFDNVVPVVGKCYRQKGDIYWSTYEIVYVGHGVALGVEIANGNNNFNIGRKTLFNASGECSGWKYNDYRACYRLTNERY